MKNGAEIDIKSSDVGGKFSTLNNSEVRGPATIKVTGTQLSDDVEVGNNSKIEGDFIVELNRKSYTGKTTTAGSNNNGEQRRDLNGGNTPHGDNGDTVYEDSTSGIVTGTVYNKKGEKGGFLAWIKHLLFGKKTKVKISEESIIAQLEKAEELEKTRKKNPWRQEDGTPYEIYNPSITVTRSDGETVITISQSGNNEHDEHADR